MNSHGEEVLLQLVKSSAVKASSLLLYMQAPAEGHLRLVARACS